MNALKQKETEENQEKDHIKNTRLTLIRETITDLQSDDSINYLKRLFLLEKRFIINQINDLKIGASIDTSIVYLVQQYYLTPILKRWITQNVSEHIKDQNYFTQNQINSLVSLLENQINDTSIWFDNVYVSPMYRYIKKSIILSERDFRTISLFENYKSTPETQELIKPVLARFKNIESTLTKAQDYNTKLMILSVCLALEEIPLKTNVNKNRSSVNNQTYIEYIQSTFIKKCDTEIKKIIFDETDLYGKIFAIH